MKMRSHVLALGLAGCGWLVSGGLFLRGLALAGRGARFAALWLPGGGDEVLASASSYQLGFPITGWGLIYFALIAFLLSAQTHWARRAALFLGAAGFGVSVLLSGILLSGSGPACPPCLALHAVNAALLIAVWLASSKEAASPQRFGFAGGAAARLIPVLCAILLGGSLEAALFREDVDLKKSLASYVAAPSREIPVRDNDAVLGPANAPVRIVVFSSFQCPACKSFNEYLRGIHRLYGDKVAVIFKHFPLGKECNPGMKADQQPRACAAAYAAEAARQQRAFWPYQDLLFATSLGASEDILEGAARQAGLDMAKWDADRRSPAAMHKVVTDVLEGKVAAVDGTPAVFVNGKRLTQINRRMLGVIISRELAAHS
jgi:protein-disulfide isomerase/uncharacterized membrane protein